MIKRGGSVADDQYGSIVCHSRFRPHTLWPAQVFFLVPRPRVYEPCARSQAERQTPAGRFLQGDRGWLPADGGKGVIKQEGPPENPRHEKNHPHVHALRIAARTFAKGKLLGPQRLPTPRRTSYVNSFLYPRERDVHVASKLLFVFLTL